MKAQTKTKAELIRELDDAGKKLAAAYHTFASKLDSLVNSLHREVLNYNKATDSAQIFADKHGLDFLAIDVWDPKDILSYIEASDGDPSEIEESLDSIETNLLDFKGELDGDDE